MFGTNAFYYYQGDLVQSGHSKKTVDCTTMAVYQLYHGGMCCGSVLGWEKEEREDVGDTLFQ